MNLVQSRIKQNWLVCKILLEFGLSKNKSPSLSRGMHAKIKCIQKDML